MKEFPEDNIILCQPGNSKGCSLCCGLFNFMDLSQSFLGTFLEDGQKREKEFKLHDEYSNMHRVRGRFTHICPYQGFLSAGKPGCYVHPLHCGVDGRDRSLFAHKICENFFCPAHTVLTTEEKKFLAGKISGWYLYTVAITDPESFSYIYSFVKSEYSDVCSIGLFTALVEEGLHAHSQNLSRYEGEIFFYSIPEYDINKKSFSIAYNPAARDHVLSMIRVKATA
jgi:hypothetical protein